MSQIAVRPRRGGLAVAVLAAAVMLAATSIARSQEEVVVLVDGEPITSLDIEHRAKFMEMSTHKTPTRQEAIDELIDEILEIREAKRYTIEPSDADVNQSFDSVASNMGVDSQKLTQILVSGGASAETLKQHLKAQIAWSSLVRGRYKASFEFPDSDVEAELQLHRPDETKSGWIRIHPAPHHLRGAAWLSRCSLRGPQARCRCAARALCELRRRRSFCSRTHGSRGGRSD